MNARFGATFAGAGAVLVGYAWPFHGAGLLLLWPAVAFLLVGAAYLGLGAKVFGKRRDGSLAPWAAVLLLPYFLCVWTAWRILRITRREPPWSELAPGVLIARRLLPRELPPGVDLIVDLTSEFAEPRPMRRSAGYRCLPILDGSVPSEEDALRLIHELRASGGKILIHCAQGHGRTAMIAALLLMARRLEPDWESALAKVRSVRPGTILNSRQARFVSRVVSRL